jgi:hypothetical protein
MMRCNCPNNNNATALTSPSTASYLLVSLCCLFVCFASSSKPLYIDLDVGQNAISIPGAVAATSIEQPVTKITNNHVNNQPHSSSQVISFSFSPLTSPSLLSSLCLSLPSSSRSLLTPSTLSLSNLPSPTTTVMPPLINSIYTNNSSLLSLPPSVNASPPPPPHVTLVPSSTLQDG